MKRGQKPKKKPEKRDDAVLQEAVVAMQNGMSYRAASRCFGIPHTTLFNYRKNNENHDVAASAVAESSTTNSTTPEPTAAKQVKMFDINIISTPEPTEDQQVESFAIKMSPTSSLSVCSDDDQVNNTFEEYLIHCSDIYTGMRPNDAHTLATPVITAVSTLQPSPTVKLIPHGILATDAVNGTQSIIQNVDAFTNYIKLEMYKITDEELQDEMHHKIQSLIFEYKRKQRVLSRQNQKEQN